MRARITATSTDLEAAGGGADHVIETVIEDLEAKSDVLRRLDEVCRDDVILASNTSQFPISKLAAATGRPDRVIGSHWFNPPAAMGLIEVFGAWRPPTRRSRTTLELAHRYGKETIVCKKDTPGFITSRLIALFMVEAARIVEEGIADADDVNKACVLAFNHALGPARHRRPHRARRARAGGRRARAQLRRPLPAAAVDAGARQRRPPRAQDGPGFQGLRGVALSPAVRLERDGAAAAAVCSS